MLSFEDSNDELHDYEYPDPPDDDDGAFSTVRCQECGQDIYEDTEQCPHCGWFVTTQSESLSGVPFWLLVGGLIGIIFTIVCLSGLLGIM